MSTTRRLYFLDNLRVALTMLVIAHHAAQAYGPTGGSWPIGEPTRSAWLDPFFVVNRSFFMSLFFLISGYLMVASYDHRGPRSFLIDRLIRLGIPTVAFGLLLTVLVRFAFHASGPFVVEVGHLWYLEHLLIFSAGYAVWRMLGRGGPWAGSEEAKIPGTIAILVLALIVAALTVLVRNFFPVDQWTYLLRFIKVAFADVPRDLACFIVGILAYRRGWFMRYPTRRGLVWLGVGAALGVLWYVYAMALGPRFPALRELLSQDDGLYCLWEAVFCLGICIGLLVLFREALDRQGRLGRFLAANQYAAYVFHLLLVMALQALALPITLPPLAKFFLVTVVAIPVTFLFCALVRKPAFMRRVF
jgi:glucan biosynthesis protein C